MVKLVAYNLTGGACSWWKHQIDTRLREGRQHIAEGDNILHHGRI
jgi:hypothetical protein